MQLLHSQFCFTRYFARCEQALYHGRVIGFNKNNCPIICMDLYPIHVLGSLALNARIGDQISFQIAADTENRKLYAELIRRVTA